MQVLSGKRILSILTKLDSIFEKSKIKCSFLGPILDLIHYEHLEVGLRKPHSGTFLR